MKRAKDKRAVNAEKEAGELVKKAARGAHRDPQDSRLLQDHRDRTTGADQAAREDMGAENPDSLIDTSGKSRRPPKERKKGV